MTTPIQGAAKPTVSNVGATAIKKPATVTASQKSKAQKDKEAAAAKKKKQSAAAKKKPAPKSATAKYLAGDTTYQQQLADFNRTKAEYAANNRRQTGIVNRDYSESQRTLQRQGAQDRIDQQEDFAGRGILRSGVFAKALGNYNTDFNSRLNALTTGRTDQLGDLAAQQKSFLSQLMTEMNNAKQDAIRRRAAKLGI